MAPIETGFLSVCILADQVGELVQAGDHGIGLDRGVNGGRFNVTLNAGTGAARLVVEENNRIFPLPW